MDGDTPVAGQSEASCSHEARCRWVGCTRVRCGEREGGGGGRGGGGGGGGIGVRGRGRGSGCVL